ncbi:MAG: hypothetical protein HY898_14395 [Deltaproteobacteria bacterium]|nr:hypothetical protein [Deltaproteobacteria bacterium]
MVYELGPLKSYVRFYLTVVAQLQAAWDTMIRTHETVRSEVAPFVAPLAPVQNAALMASQTLAPQRPSALGALWNPQDVVELSGLTDVYEVVGRFTFQGQDGENLARVQTVVSAARNEAQAQRARLADLARLPALARTCADRLAAEEMRTAAQRRAEKLAAFAPLVQTLGLRAKQTLDAVRGVPLPDLATVEAAPADYQKYVTKVDQVYQTCLPFLRKALADMYTFAGLEVPQSWPDTLPLIAELPAELATVPPADSPDLKKARSGVESLMEEETQLIRARDEIAVNYARLEGEIAAEIQREAEARTEIDVGAMVMNYAIALEQYEQAAQALASLEQQKAQRTYTVGEITGRQQQTQAAITALEQELAERTKEIGVVGQKLAVERDNEPALFGKDDWRNRVAGFEGEVEAHRNLYAQRQGILNQLKIDLSSLSVQVQTEQAQIALIDRWVADTKAKQKMLQDSARDIENRLGHARPPSTPTVVEAQQAVAALQTHRSEILERIDRYKTDIRRQKEDNARVIARLKQIELERQRVAQMAQSAQVAATQGREVALRQLAARRRAEVEKHVSEVLGGLERSLASIDSVFVEPAREAMLKDDAPRPLASEVVRENAEKIAPIVERLLGELEPQLLTQDAMLGQIQREFCDVAVEACRAAWGN